MIGELRAFIDGTVCLALPDGMLALLGDWSLAPEIDALGFYLPFSMIIVVLGFSLAWVLAWAMDLLGLARFVWHPPLFLFALMVGCSSGLALLLFPR